MTNLRTAGTLLFTFAVVPAACLAQATPVTLPAGTRFPVKTPTRLPMRAGTPIRAELLYPVYAANQLILPARTIITGSVVGLHPDHKKRLNARLRADFTPFQNPVVRFDSILPPRGAPIPVLTGDTTDGAPVYRIVPTASAKGGLLGKLFSALHDSIRSTANVFLAPEKGDRFLQFLYSQLPFHPQRIAKDTAWTVETTAPLTLAALAPPVEPAAPPTRPPANFVTRFLAPDPPAKATASEEQAAWVLEAYLDQPMSSDTSHAGQAIHATVAQPVFNADGSIAVPQGAMLTGTITQAKHSRSFDRAGILRFNFSELTLPDQEAQRVRTSIAGADSNSAQELTMDAEGQVKPKPRNKIVTPLLLVLLASRPLDRDHEQGGAGNMAGKDAAGAASLGLLSLIIGTAAQQPNLAAGLGYYSAALAIYPRFFGKGAPVAFPKDTRIVIRTTPTKSQPMRPAAIR